MSDNKVRVNLKKSFIFLLLLIFTITLVACGSQSKIPYGSINDDEYISLNDITITNKQLYDEFRLSAVDSLGKLIDDILFAEEVEAVGNLDEEYLVVQLDKIVNDAVFGVNTPKAIADLNEESRASRILQFANSSVITFTGDDPVGYDRDAIVDYFLNVVTQVEDYVADEEFNPDDTYLFGHSDQTFLVERYLLSVAKYYFARQVLVGVEGNSDLPGEMNDPDNSAYISEDALVSYFKNNILGRYDVSPLIIDFGSVLESEQARFKYAIKENSSGLWFKLPNLDDTDEFALIKAADVEDKATDAYAYAKELLTNQNIDFNAVTKIDYRTSEYRTFYNSYTISSLRDRALNDTPENNEVLSHFLRIYDDLNQTNYTSFDVNGKIVLNGTYGELNSPDRLQLEADMLREYSSSLFTKNTSLRNYIYNTLDAETNEDEEASLHYSKGVQELGSQRFLVYLLHDESANDIDVLDDSDSDNVVFQDNENAQEIRTNVLNKVIAQRLTTTYINAKVATKSEDLELSIYDPIIREFFAHADKDYNGSWGYKDNNTLAVVNGEIITVDELFSYLDKTIGFSTALDMVQRQVLDALYKDQVTKEENERFQNQLKSTLDNFAAGNFESNGFPASIGKDKFLLLAFGAASYDEALYSLYVLPRMRELYYADYENHYGTDDNIYEKWAQLSALLYEESVGVTASHLLISIDRDFDGNPDDPNLLDAAELAQLEVQVAQLIEEISLRAKLSSNMSDGLNKVVSSYGDATRYEMTYDVNDPYREDLWVPFKRHGLQLTFQSLGEITNQTNFPTSSNQYDKVFFDYTYEVALQLKDDLADRDGEKGGLIPLYGPDIAGFSLEKVRSAFGWHLVLFTDISTTNSAEVLEADAKTSEFDNPFNEGVKLSSLNNGDTITYEQILIYLKESEAETGVESLSSSVVTAITTYFSPIKSLYDGDQHKLELGFRLLERYANGSLDFNNNDVNTRLQNIRNSNIDQMFNYAYFENVAPGSIQELLLNERYAAIYGQWFAILNS